VFLRRNPEDAAAEGLPALAYLRRAGIVATRREGKWMRYRIVPPSDEHAARILQEAREYLAADREMQQDRARLVKVCFAPTLPAPLQGAPLPARLLASLVGPAQR
jgi:ArsR family transcriptional regulator, arsenate/arsenite/antimonite-responsive transcriptional repressor